MRTNLTFLGGKFKWSVTLGSANKDQHESLEMAAKLSKSVDDKAK